MDQRHRKLAEIALSVAGDQGFALAGGYAIRAHGMGDRPSGDVDLFTDWHRRADFPDAVQAVTAALEQHGYTVTAAISGETFARLLVSSPAEPEIEADKLELSADWRAHPPVLLDIGPVLHPDDAVANKMCALYGRALPRDFLDVDAAISSGRYSRDRLIELAKNADHGFDEHAFADALGALTQITDDAFADYGTPPDLITALRRSFADWRRALQSQ
ncbi:nucleotidyl transferase AbiEii/AbiGii toxin family protein [Nocardia brasiliensis]|uniref:nucleotidyl transferase AbiEii/AbiGii toxin family protein n=1 Tax=Nocardia brasiliensis TaxID=37326 RepID=UPI002458B698|nr:nucleotidyl transferase AbiEii/AbiGii toxin family protein [Nocardia brasiliensis]